MKKIKLLVMSCILGTSLISSTSVFAKDNISINRLSGQDRYGTSNAIVSQGWKKSECAVLVNSQMFADAITSAPLAKKYNAPILLTDSNRLTESTKQKLKELGVKNVIIIGGTGVVSDNVKNLVESMGLSVRRIWGQDRYETSVNVAKELGNVENAFVVSGEDWKSALTAAPIASKIQAPILLISSDGKVPSSVSNYCINNKNISFNIIGSKEFSDKISSESALSTHNSDISSYIQGDNSLDIIKQLKNKYSNNMDLSSIYLASDKGFADALSGSALAGQNGNPIILVGDTNQSGVNSFISNNNVSNVTVLGGTGVVSDTSVSSIVSKGAIPTISDEEIKKLIYNADKTCWNIHSFSSLNETIHGDNKDYTYYKLKDDVNTYDKLFKHYNTYFSERKSNYFINSRLFINLDNTFYILGCNPGLRPLILESKIENKTIDENKMNVTLLCYCEDDVNKEYPENINYTLVYENGRWLADDCANYDWNDFQYRDNHNIKAQSTKLQANK
ncbi:cell wall-binding repeat-containing protein [Clostridium sp. JS66]|uniref:cell wall-binding repeat-containing protein n=1 Tax=Clostridium sp. JS66 TaxID=3064705 RepID=UPI00298D752C|nr:cell wall-binding repeat-containing protein [Clostridium sp. JS66]WPC43916.1 cell wall-binding repeat-containing protein [Clostridium sp. JS66]